MHVTSRVFRQVWFFVFVALIPAILAAVFHPKRPRWTSDEVSLSIVENWNETPLWLDARSQADFARGHIPGALPLSQDAWHELLRPVLEAWNPGRRIVVYCSSLSCRTSHEVARRLREEVGLTEIYLLHGGWESWLKSLEK